MSSQKTKNKNLFLDLALFFLPILSMVAIISCVIIYDTNPHNEEGSILYTNIILHTNHPVFISILLTVFLLAFSFYTANRYLKNNQIIKEINDLCLFFSVIFSAYKIFFLYTDNKEINLIQEINEKPDFIILSFYLVMLTLLFSRALIFFADFIKYYEKS
ncbi:MULTISPECIES: hypothetical protein [Pectobacterium]|uniref:hypothetical protein n=1 Tax=Pectobacterium TaxID=122277 RepID=UPI0006514E8E|nr:MULTISPECIES: hypothetical protein [Pectobacterium]KMK81522.1 hypothetical protein KCO_19292 [Pectobacterium brasiliense ICMP 19477]